MNIIRFNHPNALKKRTLTPSDFESAIRFVLWRLRAIELKRTVQLAQEELEECWLEQSMAAQNYVEHSNVLQFPFRRPEAP